MKSWQTTYCKNTRPDLKCQFFIERKLGFEVNDVEIAFKTKLMSFDLKFRSIPSHYGNWTFINGNVLWVKVDLVVDVFLKFELTFLFYFLTCSKIIIMFKHFVYENKTDFV